MNQYPSIEGASKAPHQPCFGFVKYDGSNLRFEWTPKRGWYKFGTREEMFDRTHPVFGPSIDLFVSKYDEGLIQVFKKSKLFRGVRSFIVFAEFFGEKSFAGMHFPEDQKWDIVVFDVNPHKQGILGPKIFVDEFGHLPVAEVCYQGNLNKSLIESVRKSELDFTSKYEVKTAVPEGIICKGGIRHWLWMAKIKSENYRAELRKRYENDWIKYWE